LLAPAGGEQRTGRRGAVGECETRLSVLGVEMEELRAHAQFKLRRHRRPCCS
jgi:hypothetical protein